MGMRTVRMDPITVAATVGSGRTKVPVSGELFGFRVQGSGSPNATLTITDDDGQTIATLAANTDTSKWYYPRPLLQAPAGTDLVAVYDRFPIDGYLYLSISSGNNGQVTTLTFKVLEQQQS